MVKLPPPFWALAYTLIAIGASYLMGWPRVPGLPLVWPGVVLIVLGIGLSVTAAMLFRREGTEINPTSPANRKACDLRALQANAQSNVSRSRPR
jgi:hypothetical protein